MQSDPRKLVEKLLGEAKPKDLKLSDADKKRLVEAAQEMAAELFERLDDRYPDFDAADDTPEFPNTDKLDLDSDEYDQAYEAWMDAENGPYSIYLELAEELFTRKTLELMQQEYEKRWKPKKHVLRILDQ